MEKTKRCPMCGEEILAVAKKCRFCGEFLDEDAKRASMTPPGKSRATYIMLGLFFGNFGAHNFYIGDKASGRIHIYLLFLPVIGWLISAVMAIWEVCTVSKDASGHDLI